MHTDKSGCSIEATMTEIGPLHCRKSVVCSGCGRTFTNFGTFANHGKYATDCTPEMRFWGKVKKTETCWLYTGFLKWDGYGWLCHRTGTAKGRYLTAHRYAWMLTHGEPPEGAHIMHTCDVPACCNPAHLRLGTHSENMADMAAKGRSRSKNSPKETLLYPERVRPVRRNHDRPE